VSRYVIELSAIRIRLIVSSRNVSGQFYIVVKTFVVTNMTMRRQAVHLNRLQ
jgi:hypothetical protein